MSKSTLLDLSGHLATLLGIRNDNDGCLVVVGGVGGVGGCCAGEGAIPTMGAVRYYDIELIAPPYIFERFFGGDNGKIGPSPNVVRRHGLCLLHHLRLRRSSRVFSNDATVP